MMRVRIVDVAADLGVSISTVSKALTDSPEISSETRARVRARADELGYRPNGAARRLRTGRMRAIGLLSHDSIGRQSLPVLLGAEEAFGVDQTAVLLSDGRGDPVRVQHRVRAFLEHGIDGIIMLGGSTDEQPSLGEVGVPVVYAYGQSSSPEDYSVVPDEAEGAAAAVELLVGLGRRAIGHITGPTSYAATQRRAVAAQRVLASYGLAFSGGKPLSGEWTEHWGRVAADLLLRRAPETDAIFCGSDVIARGVLDAVQRHGRSVPNDIAVIGFDNWESWAAGSNPSLTTVDMHLGTVGRRAAEALVSAIEKHPKSGVLLTECSLVIRQSTA
ncbi:substrate-binding domain-containing protein [Rathayibacter sp. VKM Ac-2760]|nr:substrate-binding domain-containing protein [Rathayibacter sp. VKM Ac-2760]